MYFSNTKFLKEKVKESRKSPPLSLFQCNICVAVMVFTGRFSKCENQKILKVPNSMQNCWSSHISNFYYKFLEGGSATKILKIYLGVSLLSSYIVRFKKDFRDLNLKKNNYNKCKDDISDMFTWYFIKFIYSNLRNI